MKSNPTSTRHLPKALARRSATGLLIGAALFSAQAMAHEAGAVVVRAGAAMVAPNESSSELKVITADIGDISGARVGVDNDTQLGLTLSYAFSDHLALGVLGATPFQHTINGTEGLAGFGELGSTKHLPPTITLQYFPLAGDSRVQPYVGAGLNYTKFFQEKTTSNLTAAFQYVADAYGTGLTVNDVDMKLDDSFGVAVEAGVDMMITDNLMLNAAVWYININTEATLTGHTAQGVNIDAKVDVDIDPTVYMLSLGYKF